jgi:phenylacetate-CoA ligase
MLIVRGVNVFPSAIEGIVRRFLGIDEFLIEVYRQAEMDEVRLLLEVGEGDGRHLLATVQEAVRVELGIRIEAVPVPAHSLPRYELKARRVVRRTSG